MNNVKLHYAAGFDLSKSQISNDENIFRIVLFIIGNWVQQHIRDSLLQKEVFKKWFYQGGSMDGLRGCNKAESRTYDYNSETNCHRYWVFKFEHEDSQQKERIWSVVFGLEVIDLDRAYLSISLSWRLRSGYIGEEPPLPIPSVPRVVKYILTSDHLYVHVSTMRVAPDSIKLDAGMGRDCYRKIISKDRELPIIILNLKQLDMRDFPDKLQQSLLGSAFVFWYNDFAVHSEFQYEWGNKADAYQCAPDSIRIYQPNLDFSLSKDSTRHRYFKLDDFTGRTHELIKIVAQSILRIITSKLTRKGIYSFESLNSIIHADRLKKLKIAASQEKISKEEKDYIDALEEENLSLNSMVTLLKKEADLVVEYQIQLEDAQLRAEKAEKQFSLIAMGEKDFSDFKKVLQKQQELLRHYPSTVKEVLILLAATYADRILLLPEAVQSAEETEFEDLSKVWDIISHFGTTLYDFVFNLNGGNLEMLFKNSTNYDLSMKDSKEVKDNPKFMRLRTRIYNQEKISIIPHIKAESRGRHFRLHFFIDTRKKILVIGHCGDHLDTPGTKRRKD